MEICKPIILSHKRAKSIVTHKTVANSAVCVPKSQVDEYKQYVDCEIIEHPDDVIGYAAKVKWIYKHFPNVFMLDDDMDYLLNLYDDGKKPHVDPVDIYYLIQSNADVARQLGVKYFGFGKMNKPLMYKGLRPLELTGFVIGGQMGFLEGFQMDEMPDEVIGSTDYFLSALNAHYNRMTFIDQRFAFCSKGGTFKSEGGMADIRDLESEKKDLLELKAKFGDAIELKKSTALRTLQHQYERTLKIPF